MLGYLSPEEVLAIHSELIDRYGGSHGIRDLSLLESAVARPRAGFGEFEAYPTIWAKAAVLAHSIIRNHPFIDGNKRTGVTSAILFIERNDYLIESTERELVALALGIAAKEFDETAIAEWLERHSQL